MTRTFGTRRPTAVEGLLAGSGLTCPAWVRDRPWLADTVLALVLAGGTLATMANLESALNEDVVATPSSLVDWLVVLGPAGFVPIRRLTPTVAVVGGAVMQMTSWSMSLPDNYVTMTLLLYTAAAATSVRSQRAAIALTAVLSLFTLAGVLVGDAPFYALPLVALMSAAAVAIGGTMRRREAYLEAVEARAMQAERSRLAEGERARSEERNRIARELHDVVAHGLSVVVVQAGGAQRTLDRDAEATRDALRRIEETGRTALREMRHVLSVIRTDPDESWRPAPGLDGLTELIEDLAETGLDVTLAERDERDRGREGEPGDIRGNGNGDGNGNGVGRDRPGRDLPVTVDLTAYRIVQESLTNVLKHGGRNARASVEIVHTPSSLDLAIIDNGYGAASTDQGGHGLRGMQERVEVFGGEFSAGPRLGGGFAVRVSLPLDQTAAT